MNVLQSTSVVTIFQPKSVTNNPSQMQILYKNVKVFTNEC
jgi:hypothetical protein